MYQREGTQQYLPVKAGGGYVFGEKKHVTHPLLQTLQKVALELPGIRTAKALCLTIALFLFL
ncbi:hypothetical protein [Mucilaginibacter ginsenosidivorans]|uniref:Uncharacterized protein n=1 Tax=Mucilaginibacter ginsenosidivorans TaxID=398053 RepID=A0A5B8UYU9_9SPHI|nr:hypothetical protein [Mucilaginibacter ginsenosidivorans]QEC63551.1 hypothetical protein FRZ54_13515 [Mucilaginibacter ginsenosidivorans]